MKRIALLLTLLLSCSTLLPAQQRGEITAEMLASMRAALPGDASFTALENAVAGTDVSTLAVDHDVLISGDEHFTHRIQTSGITDQKRSGRCWLFAGLNIMRPTTAKLLGVDGFAFSQNYLFFYDKLEKANMFLENIIALRDRPVDDRDVEWLLRHPLPDGGQWNMVVALIRKYGVVPAKVMPETHSSSNSSSMNAVIGRKLVGDAAQLRRMNAEGASADELSSAKNTMLSDVYRMLAMHLGVPPTSFVWRSTDSSGTVGEAASYTPQEFYRRFVDIDLDEYICLHNVPSHGLNRVYSIRYDRNMVDVPDMVFINLPMERLTEYTLASVLADEPVWFGCDVGQDSDRKKGLMKLGLYDYASLYGITLSMNKADRIRYGLGSPSHAMVITGVDVVENMPRKWLVENSWGTDVGEKGMFVMDQGWFEEYTYSVIINRRFLPQDVLDLLRQTSEELPPWDPMYDTQ
jgi:bleomycin hydrolase